jgi:5'-3' exoribonuclease 2
VYLLIKQYFTSLQAMGVPTLFRWLRDRYPKMIQMAQRDIKIDNFYIDMNGMIHPCFHPDGSEGPKTIE